MGRVKELWASWAEESALDWNRICVRTAPATPAIDPHDLNDEELEELIDSGWLLGDGEQEDWERELSLVFDPIECKHEWVGSGCPGGKFWCKHCDEDQT